MQTVGLIGYPLGHSISPAFQQAAFDCLGIDARYELWETPEKDVEKFVKGIRLPDKLGANVTVPYKELVIPLLDGLSDIAADVGAVNTIVKQGSKLIGHNTDAIGFLRALTEEGKFNPAQRNVMMIGAGGVARAIGFILLKSGVSSLDIFDIDGERAGKLAQDLKSSLVTVLDSNEGDQYDQAVSSADLIVNCTPVGMIHTSSEGKSPIRSELISPRSTVYDVVYNPSITRLMSDAQDAGAASLGGLSMLVFQGVAAFELWTGKTAPVDIMMQAAVNAM